MRANPEIAILGFGQEGKAVFRFLKKRTPKLKIAILDQKFDKNYLKNLEKFKIVFRSPGVPYTLPQIKKAIKRGVLFSSATDLFLKNAKGKIIGITGTKGKGTTSTLLYKILKNAGWDAYLAGNIGKPAISILPKLKKHSWTVLELSSFQLQDLKESPRIAVVLNIFPDHMDVHKNFGEYLVAKGNIARRQKKRDRIFYDAESKTAPDIARLSQGKKIGVSRLFSNSREWANSIKEVIKIPGEHNFKNALVASVVAVNLGIPQKIILKTIKNYRGIHYRIELVRTYTGVRIYNDSASTNPQTTIAAIESFVEPKIIIMGGYDKKLDYKPVRRALKNSNTKMVVLFGENKKKIRRAIGKTADTKIVHSLRAALKTALKITKKGDVVLFSPGAASFDMFKDYKDRGKKFNEIVKRLGS